MSEIEYVERQIEQGRQELHRATELVSRAQRELDEAEEAWDAVDEYEPANDGTDAGEIAYQHWRAAVWLRYCEEQRGQRIRALRDSESWLARIDPAAAEV